MKRLKLIRKKIPDIIVCRLMLMACSCSPVFNHTHTVSKESDATRTTQTGPSHRVLSWATEKVPYRFVTSQITMCDDVCLHGSTARCCSQEGERRVKSGADCGGEDVIVPLRSPSSSVPNWLCAAECTYEEWRWSLFIRHLYMQAGNKTFYHTWRPHWPASFLLRALQLIGYRWWNENDELSSSDDGKQTEIYEKNALLVIDWSLHRDSVQPNFVLTCRDGFFCLFFENTKRNWIFFSEFRKKMS